jgi:hypothetical protein
MDGISLLFLGLIALVWLKSDGAAGGGIPLYP